MRSEHLLLLLAIGICFSCMETKIKRKHFWSYCSIDISILTFRSRNSCWGKKREMDFHFAQKNDTPSSKIKTNPFLCKHNSKVSDNRLTFPKRWLIHSHGAFTIRWIIAGNRVYNFKFKMKHHLIAIYCLPNKYVKLRSFWMWVECETSTCCVNHVD